MSYKDIPEKKNDESVEEWLKRAEKACPEIAIPHEEKPILDIDAIYDEMVKEEDR